MDASLRITLAVSLSLLAAFIVGKFFGNTLLWIIVFVALGIATESALRSLKNNQKFGKQNKKLESLNIAGKSQEIKPEKPPKVRF